MRQRTDDQSNCIYSKKYHAKRRRKEQRRTVNPNDILLWTDNFWCYREELSPEFLRDDKYREILRSSDEWLRMISSGRSPTSSPGRLE